MTACIVSNCRAKKATDSAPIGTDQQIGPVCLACATEIDQHPERFRICVGSVLGEGRRIWIDRVIDTGASQVEPHWNALTASRRGELPWQTERCGACGGPFLGDEWLNRHIHDGGVMHAACCTDDRHSRQPMR